VTYDYKFLPLFFISLFLSVSLANDITAAPGRNEYIYRNQLIFQSHIWIRRILSTIRRTRLMLLLSLNDLGINSLIKVARLFNDWSNSFLTLKWCTHSQLINCVIMQLLRRVHFLPSEYWMKLSCILFRGRICYSPANNRYTHDRHLIPLRITTSEYYLQ